MHWCHVLYIGLVEDNDARWDEVVMVRASQYVLSCFVPMVWAMLSGIDILHSSPLYVSCNPLSVSHDTEMKWPLASGAYRMCCSVMHSLCPLTEVVVQTSPIPKYGMVELFLSWMRPGVLHTEPGMKSTGFLLIWSLVLLLIIHLLHMS
jgi:hypothetical protein